MTHFILTEMYCADIAYIGDAKLAIAMTADNRGKVQIMNFSGRVIHTIDRDEKGESLFQCPYYLNTNMVERVFYVSDWLNDSFYKVDIDTLSTYQYSPRIWHPFGITTDGDGFIYVCESGTDSIHVYHTDDTKNTDKEVLLKFNDYNPQALLFSASMSKLYVSFDGSDRLKVYNIITS
jgi:formylmethanofuran dehydrogenase subunit E-like metal-binding protein